MGMSKQILKRLDVANEVIDDQVETIQQLDAKCEAIIASARDWKARTRILAQDRDTWRALAEDSAKDLAALRQTRAAERAQSSGSERLEKVLTDAGVRNTNRSHVDDVAALAESFRSYQAGNANLREALRHSEAKRTEAEQAAIALHEAAQAPQGEASIVANPALLLESVVQERDRLKGELEKVQQAQAGPVGLIETERDKTVALEAALGQLTVLKGVMGAAERAAGDHAKHFANGAFDVVGTIGGLLGGADSETEIARLRCELQGVTVECASLREDLKDARASNAALSEELAQPRGGFHDNVRELLQLPRFGVESALVAIRNLIADRDRLKADLAARDAESRDLRAQLDALRLSRPAGYADAAGPDRGGIILTRQIDESGGRGEAIVDANHTERGGEA